MTTRTTRTLVPSLCAIFALCCASAGVEPSSLTLEPAFPSLDFTRPVDLQHPGDGTNRLFVVEQAGVIHVFENQSDVGDTGVFLDIQDRVNDEGNEEGLLGLAFHPEFETNGYFYVDYTAANPRRTVIARYRVDSANPDQADPQSETVLLEVPQPYSNHNGGQIAFGPDGFLYISLGDGGSGGDPQENGQNPATLLGSILRIDIDNPSEGRPYGIPSDNPFVDGANGARPEIYAYGLRNAWRFSFDPETNRLWAADVGQNAFEEVDIIEKGKNYGWDVMEASSCFEPEEGCDQADLTLPIWEYGREDGVSVTGGYVYRGTRAPQLTGRYLVADYASGKVWALEYDGRQTAQAELLMDTDLNISSFGVDQNGEQYVLAFDGNVYHFAPSEGN
jgi:glucose/arabinose dehydrogenase